MGKRQKRKRREGHPVAGAASLQKPGLGRQANSPSAAMTMSPVPPASKGGMVADGIAHDLHTGSVLAGENGNRVGCRHWERGIDLEKLRAQLAKGVLVPQQCHGCGNGGNNTSGKGKDRRVNNKGKGKAVRNNKQSVWICLACGQIGCGTLTLVRDHALQKSINSSKNGNGNNSSTESSLVKQMGDGHAKTHGKQVQHPVVMQLGQRLDCWCLVCNLQIYSSGGGSAAVIDSRQPNNPLGLDADAGDGGTSNGGSKPEWVLKGAVNLVQESLSRNNAGRLKLDVAEKDQTPEVIKGCISPSTPMAAVGVNSLSSRRVIKGLMNLGNTCFFNSVMQNLVGVSMLRDHFSLEASMREGNLTTALRKFFQDMDVEASEKLDVADRNPDGTLSGPKRITRSRSLAGSIGSAVTPRGLFSAISTKAPRFKGYQQQDSHELLRCLLDGLHTEEESVRKCRSASAGSGAVREVESAAKSDASEEGRNNHHTAYDEGSEAVADKTAKDTFVERMFGGQLSSTVSCCVCGHSSVVYEPFLDLSLPIPSKQSPRKNAPSVEQFPLSILPWSHQGHSGASAQGLNEPASLEAKSSVVHWEPTTEDSNRLARNVTGISVAESGIGMSEVMLHVDNELVKNPDPTTPYKEHGTGVVVIPDTCPRDVSSSAECASGPDLDASPDTWMDFLTSDETSEEPGATILHTPKEVDEWNALPQSQSQSQSQSQPPAGEAQNVDTGGKETSQANNCYGREQRGGDFEDKVDLEESGCLADEGSTIYGPLNNWEVLEGVIDGLSPGLTKEADAPSQVGADMHLSTPRSLATANSLSMEGGLAVSSYVVENTGQITSDSQQLVSMPSINKVERSDSVVMQVVSEEDGGFDGVASMFEEASSLEKKEEDQPSWTLVESRQREPRSFLGQINGLDCDTGCNGNNAEVDSFQFASNGGREASIKEGWDGDSYSSMSLEGCLLAFTKAEVLSGENAWDCESCSRRLQDQWRADQRLSCDWNQASEHLKPQSQPRRENRGKRAAGYSDKDIIALQAELPAQIAASQQRLLEVEEKTAEESNNSRELISGMNYLVKRAAEPNAFDTDIFKTSTVAAEQHFTDSDTADLEQVTEVKELVTTSVVDSESNVGASMSPSKCDLELTSLLQQSASKNHSDELGGLRVIQAAEFQPRTLHGAAELLLLTPSVLPVTSNDCSDINPGRGGLNGPEQTVLSEVVQTSSSDVLFKDIAVDMSGKVDSLLCDSDAEENGPLLEKSGPLHCLAGEKKLSFNGSYDIYEATTSSDVYRHRNFSLDSRQNSPLPTKISTVSNGGNGDSLEADRSSVQDTPKAFTVKQDATKRLLLSKAPPVLTVHLKRFAQDLHGRLSKLGGHVAFSEQLDLGPFMDQRWASNIMLFIIPCLFISICCDSFELVRFEDECLTSCYVCFYLEGK